MLKKTYLIIYFAIFIVCVAYLINYINKSIVLEGIEDIEIRQADIDIKELYRVFIGAAIRLRQHAEDIAIRDDSYDFINNTNNDYIIRNYSKTHIEQNHFTAIAYYNKHGNRIKFIDGSKDEYGSEWVELEKKVFDKSVKTYKDMEEDFVEGYVNINEVQMIVVVYKVYDSNKKYPSNGYIVIGFALGDIFDKLANTVSNYSFSILRVGAYQAIEKTTNKLSENSKYILKDKMIYVYTIINDIFGKPAFCIEFKKNRDIYNIGSMIFKKNLQMMFLLCFIVMLGSMILLYIAHRISIKEEVEYRTKHDLLTDLPNLSLFLEELPKDIELAKDNNLQIGICFIGLDDFKVVNNCYGYEFGNRMLCCMVQRLHDLLPYGYSARPGGDNFIVAISVENDNVMVNQANYILSALEQPYIIDNNMFFIEASIGVVIIKNEECELADYVRQAELAMSDAKKNGGGCISLYDDKMTEKAIYKKKLEIALRKATEDDSLTVYFQPKIDVLLKDVVGCEALARWQIDGKWISPAEFIPIAEETGLVKTIDMFVLRTACRQVLEWKNMGYGDIPIAVNMSVNSILSDNFSDEVKRVLDEEGTPSFLIDIEITESTFATDTKKVLSAISSLNEFGIRIALDDFGTGYSSIKYLSIMPISNLKIDKSFVDDIFSGKATAQPLVKSIISLASNLGIHTVSEGVEDKNQLAFLVGNGAHIIQGYLFSKPLNASDFIDYLDNRKIRVASVLQDQ